MWINHTDEILKAHGYNVCRLAEETGLDRTTLYRFVAQGRANIHLKIASLVMKKFGVGLDDLFEYIENGHPGKETAEPEKA